MSNKNKGEKPLEGNEHLDDLGSTESEKKQSNVEELLLKLTKQLDEQANIIKDQAQKLDDLETKKNSGDLNAELIGKIVSEVRKGTQADMGESIEDKIRYYNEENIDPDDVLKEPKIFYAYNTGYVIVDDKRGSKFTRTPLKNTILFLHQATQKLRDGNGHWHLQSYSTYPSYSKKEVAWLKNHSKFQIHFFETIKEAMETNADIAQRITKHINALNSLRPEQIINICKEKGIGHNTDVQNMKNKLALIAVQNEIEGDKKSREEYFTDIFKTEMETAGRL